MSASKRKAAALPSQFRGFLGNGGWLVATHTRVCARQRRGVCRGERIRSLIPSRAPHFATGSAE